RLRVSGDKSTEGPRPSSRLASAVEWLADGPKQVTIRPECHGVKGRKYRGTINVGRCRGRWVRSKLAVVQCARRSGRPMCATEIGMRADVDVSRCDRSTQPVACAS